MFQVYKILVDSVKLVEKNKATCASSPIIDTFLFCPSEKASVFKKRFREIIVASLILTTQGLSNGIFLHLVLVCHKEVDNW